LAPSGFESTEIVWGPEVNMLQQPWVKTNATKMQTSTVFFMGNTFQKYEFLFLCLPQTDCDSQPTQQQHSTFAGCISIVETTYFWGFFEGFLRFSGEIHYLSRRDCQPIILTIGTTGNVPVKRVGRWQGLAHLLTCRRPNRPEERQVSNAIV